MLKHVAIIATICFITISAKTQNSDRQLWLSYMDKVARPVLSNLAEDKLKENMAVELSAKIDDSVNRKAVSYLEAFGRTLSGIAPWLNLESGSKDEVALRNQYREWTLKA